MRVSADSPALPAPPSIVIDTNIALDLLVFEDPAWAPLAAVLAAGELRWVATEPMRGELARVLRYPLIARRMALSEEAALNTRSNHPYRHPSRRLLRPHQS